MFAFIVEEVLEIEGRGVVICGKYNSLKYQIQLTEYLYDSSFNQYVIKGFEMIRRKITAEESPENQYIGMLIETNNKPSNYFIGKLLTTEYTNGFLFPANPIDNKLADYDYEEEYNNAKIHGILTMLLDLDKLENSEKVQQYHKRDIIMHLIYRGWMISPKCYRKLYEELSKQSYFLINSPEQYEYCHLLPRWYNDFEDITPKSVWSEDITYENIQLMLKKFGDKPVMIKDYVKSRKHEWFEACYIPKASETQRAINVVRTFLERQGENLIGGLVIREFVELAFTGYHPKSGMKLSAEYRAFFINWQIIYIIDYWGNNVPQYELNADEYLWVQELGKRVKSNFFTIDIARKADGSLIVMELGDGQVSGLQDFSEKEFYNKIIEMI